MTPAQPLPRRIGAVLRRGGLGPLVRLGRPLLRGLAGATIAVAESGRGFRTPQSGYIPHRLDMLRGRYEPDEAAYLAREAEGARLVLDVGANVGYFTRLFAERVAADGRVVAFEPNPEPFRYLVRNTRRYPNVLPLAVGLAEKPGVFDLFTSERDSATGSLSAGAVRQTAGSVARLRSVRVVLTRTEEMLASLGLDEPDVVKVDVEGWELNVFRSFGPGLARWQRTRFLFELNPAAMRGAGISLASLVDFWTQAGYRLFFLEAQGRTTPASGAEIEQRCAACPGNSFYTSLVARR